MKHVCIIAEAGVNHNGSLEIAMKLAKAAKDAGADYVKFQTFNPKKMVSKFAEKAKYQKETTDDTETQLEMLEKLSLSDEEFGQLQKYCKQLDIGFISTPFDIDSIKLLETFHMDFWKIPSGEITNLPYLEYIAKTGMKVILSTGMSTIDEITSAINVLENNGTKDITLLHCNTQYPTPYEDVNLNAMLTIKNVTNKVVGYSDHTIGIEVPIAAVAIGAQVIEKHFTLDKSMEGPDHKSSLDPTELKAMVSAIRNIEKTFGSTDKAVSSSELPNKVIARKSIVANCNIKKGELFTEFNLTTKRPGNGISPMKWHDVIGLKAKRDFKEDELIEL